ncbi:MAG: pyrimidine dimer DNA glycosylase/endonuclease V [Candidatus Margulisiibacteriota bacterium]
MRLWSLHPTYLDTKGLVASWREGLLALHVVLGKTKGYVNHPQLNRFKASQNPVAYVATFLDGITTEAKARNYNFDRSKITDYLHPSALHPLTVTQGQLAYEWQHFLKKIETRDPARFEQLKTLKNPTPHPLFNLIPGDVEPWEIV